MKRVRSCLFVLAILGAPSLLGCGPDRGPNPIQNSAPNSVTNAADPAASLAEDGNAVDPEVDFIVGGVRVSGKTDFVARSTVALVARETEGVAICSGTLIAPDVILTAGHCVEAGARNLRAVFSRTLSRAEGHVMDVAAIARPEGYAIGKPRREDRDLDDLALVKLSGEAPAPYHVADLPPADYDLKDNTPLVLAGYGIVHGQDSSSRGNAGAGTLRKVAVRVENAHYGKTEILINQEKGHGACHGDSGGPAYVHAHGDAFVVGVTSRGLSDEPDDCLHHSIYTSVAAHRAWIEKTLTQLRSR